MRISTDPFKTLFIVGAILAIFGASLGTGGPLVQSSPVFEAATVKIVKSGSRAGSVRMLPGGRLHASGADLKNLVLTAYRTEFDQLAGGPSWIETERYDVEATAGRDASKDEMRLMLQSLIEDKFKLKVHREMRPTEVYELVAAKSGMKLSPPKEGGCRGTDGMEALNAAGPFIAPCGSLLVRSGVPAHLDGGSILVKDLAEMLRFQEGRIVLDKTGYSGKFDLHMEFVSMNLALADNPGYGTILTALQEQLGLKLQAATDPIEFIVIDHAEKLAE